MYPNLKAEMARRDITITKIAKSGKVKCNSNTLSLKLRGKYPLTFDEAIAIKEAIGTKLSLEELFSKEVL